jgi:hypothetical protein
MSAGKLLVLAATLLYIATGITQAFKGNWPMCIVWSGYAAANVGLMMVTE